MGSSMRSLPSSLGHGPLQAAEYKSKWSEKEKAPVSQRDRGRLCVTTLFAAPLRDAAALRPQTRADGITPVKRPGLLQNGSAGGSKGIFPAGSRPPCTKRRLSLREFQGYLSLSTPDIEFFPMISLFFCLSTGFRHFILQKAQADFTGSGSVERYNGRCSFERVHS